MQSALAPDETGQAGRAQETPRPDRGPLAALVAGGIGGLLAVSASISYPAAIFVGAFEPHLGFGIKMALLGSAILGVVIALGSSYRAAIANIQIETAVVLGAIAMAVGEAYRADARLEASLPDLLAIIVVSTLSMGVVFITLGACRLGNAIRFIPYPVIGAFLAYIAWLLVQSGMTTMIGRTPAFADMPAIFRSDMVLLWLPATLVAIGLVVLQLRRRHHLNVPAAVVAITGGFWVVASLAGVSREALGASGYLLDASAGDAAHSPLMTWAALGEADWLAVAAVVPQIVVVWLVAMIALLVSASSLEVVTRSDIDLNRELKVTGLANLASAVGGGLPGYHAVSACLLPHYLGTRSRLVGLISAATCASVYLASGPLLAFVPKMLLGMVLLYLAFDIAAELLLDRWPRISPADRCILLLVLAALVGLGFVEGLAIGIVAALAVFAFTYGQIETVLASGTGASFVSSLKRPASQLRLLARHGDAIRVIRLQGYLFFGSAQRMREQVVERLSRTEPASLRFLIVDFEGVAGADSSAIFSLVRLVEEARQRAVTVVFAAVPEVVHARMGSRGGTGGGLPAFFARDLDTALQRAEDALLLGVATDEPEPLAEDDGLSRALPDRVVREGILRYCSRVEWHAGHRAIRQGDQAHEMFFIISGRLTVWLETNDVTSLRLGTILPGTAIGEVGFYSGAPRTASVVTDEETTAIRITRQALDQIAHEQAGLAVAFHEFMARSASERLAYNTSLLGTRAEG